MLGKIKGGNRMRQATEFMIRYERKRADVFIEVNIATLSQLPLQKVNRCGQIKNHAVPL